MTKAVEFLYLFFTTEMISTIVTHTNSYSNEHIFPGTHQSYAGPDGSWQDATADEIAILIYFGLVKVVGMLEQKDPIPWALGMGHPLQEKIQIPHGPVARCRSGN